MIHGSLAFDKKDHVAVCFWSLESASCEDLKIRFPCHPIDAANELTQMITRMRDVRISPNLFFIHKKERKKENLFL